MPRLWCAQCSRVLSTAALLLGGGADAHQAVTEPSLPSMGKPRGLVGVPCAAPPAVGPLIRRGLLPDRYPDSRAAFAPSNVAVPRLVRLTVAVPLGLRATVAVAGARGRRIPGCLLVVTVVVGLLLHAPPNACEPFTGAAETAAGSPLRVWYWGWLLSCSLCRDKVGALRRAARRQGCLRWLCHFRRSRGAVGEQADDVVQQGAVLVPGCSRLRLCDEHSDGGNEGAAVDRGCWPCRVPNDLDLPCVALSADFCWGGLGNEGLLASRASVPVNGFALAGIADEGDVQKGVHQEGVVLFLDLSPIGYHVRAPVARLDASAAREVLRVDVWSLLGYGKSAACHARAQPLRENLPEEVRDGAFYSQSGSPS
eukprot:15768406-Heterocapsa_arctica.AAC.1